MLTLCIQVSSAWGRVEYFHKLVLIPTHVPGYGKQVSL